MAKVHSYISSWLKILKLPAAFLSSQILHHQHIFSYQRDLEIAFSNNHSLEFQRNPVFLHNGGK